MAALAVAFHRTHRSFLKIRDIMNNIQERIERWENFPILFFQAPVIEREHLAVDAKVDQVE